MCYFNYISGDDGYKLDALQTQLEMIDLCQRKYGNGREKLQIDGDIIGYICLQLLEFI